MSSQGLQAVFQESYSACSVLTIQADPVNLLNDILNKRKSSHLLSWEFQQQGPGHDPVHIAIAKGV